MFEKDTTEAVQEFFPDYMFDTQLPREIETGNIEYKLKLVDKSADRFSRLVTQLKWRIAEGNGQAIYEIGVSDNGAVVGLTKQDLDASLSTLRRMAEEIRAECTILRQLTLRNSLSVAEVKVQEKVIDDKNQEIRIVLIGPRSSGKTTLLHKLTETKKDLKPTFQMEVDIIGLNNNNVINYSSRNVESQQHVAQQSQKIIMFLDTNGSTKFLLTQPHFVILVTNNLHFHEQIGILLLLQIPFCLVLNRNLVQEITCILKSANKQTIVSRACIFNENEVPLFFQSDVNLLKTYILSIPDPPIPKSKACEFHILKIFHVPGVGTVVFGTQVSGILSSKSLFLGPFLDGFRRIQVESIYRFQRPVQRVYAGQSATLHLEGENPKLGMVILDFEPKLYLIFEVNLRVLYHYSTLTVGSKLVLFTQCSKQPVQIHDLDCELATGDVGRVQFRFLNQAQFIQPNMNVLIRDGKLGRIKCLGTVIKLL